MSIAANNLRKSRGFLVLIALGAMMGGLSAIISAKFLPYLIGACVLSGVAFLSFIKPVLLIYFVILTSASAGLLHNVGSLGLGSASLTVSGLRWVFVAGIALPVVVVNIRRIKPPRHFIPFLVFAFWAAARWASTIPNTIGLKDILFYSLPPLIGLYTLFTLSLYGRKLVGRIQKALLYSVFVPMFLYATFVPLGLVYLTERGPKGLIGPRPVATYLLVILSLSLASWRYATSKTHRHRVAFVSLLALGIIVFTLSRIAAVMALFLFATFKLNPLRPRQFLLRGFVAAVLSVSLLLGVPSFRARLFHGIPSSLTEALERLNTSGRNVMWPTTFNHALEKPILGWGPGSARPLVAEALFGKEVEVYHPHNEYLQVFHDTGIIGLTLLLLAWLPLLVRYWKRWRFAHLSRDVIRAKWNMAATLAVLLVLIDAIVNNTLHYAFIIAPVFLVLGCADFLNSSWRGAKLRPLAT